MSRLYDRVMAHSCEPMLIRDAEQFLDFSGTRDQLAVKMRGQLRREPLAHEVDAALVSAFHEPREELRGWTSCRESGL